MMKASIVILTCLFFGFAANAQIAKNSTLVGGQILVYNSDIDYSNTQPNQKNKNTVFNLSIGRAFRENSIYGLNLSYGTAVEKNFYTGLAYVNYNAKQYNIGVFNRRYKTLASDLYFFAEFGGGFVTSKEINTDTLGKTLKTYKQTGGELSLTPGISYQILRKVQLEIMIPRIISVQYAVTKGDDPTLGTSRQKQFLVLTSLKSPSLSSLGVGFTIVL